MASYHDEDASSALFIGGSAILVAIFLGYRYYQKNKTRYELEGGGPSPPFPGVLEGQIINQGERPFGLRDYTEENPFGIKFNDPQSENFHIQNNRTRAIAMVYRYVVEMSWLPVDPIGTRSALDELARIKDQSSSCASVIYDNMQILIFNRDKLVVEEEDDIAISIAKAYLKFRNFTPHPGIPIDHVC